MDTNYNIKWFKGYKDLPEAYYRLKVPSVSKIVNEIPDPEFEKWKEEMGEEKVEYIMQQAAYRGTAMHCYIENFLNELKNSADPSKALKYTQETSLATLEKEEVPDNKIKLGRNLFYNYYYSEFCSSKFKILGTEVLFYSPKLFYRGFIDFLFQQSLKGISVTDFKTTSSRIQKGSVKEKKYKSQLGAYTLGLEHLYEQKGKNIKIEYASILAMHTKSESIQQIVCEGDDLENYKEYVKTLIQQWHKNNNQEFLFESKDNKKQEK